MSTGYWENYSCSGFRFHYPGGYSCNTNEERIVHYALPIIRNRKGEVLLEIS